MALAALSAVLCLPAMAQKEDHAAYHEDSYYLEGAVPEVNGKVVFEKNFSIPGMSQQEVYDKALEWAEAHMKGNENANSRVAYTDKSKGQIAATGLEYVVFQSAGLSLDRVKLSYQMLINCANEECRLEFRQLRYDYPSTDEKFTAEESISDEYALNKDHTKLIRGWAKFRRKTVDWVDDMNRELQLALSGVPAANTNSSAVRNADEVTVIGAQDTHKAVETTKAVEAPKATETVKPTVAEAPATASAPQGSGFKSINPDALTADMVKVSEGRLVIMVNGNSITANAGGYLSKQGGKTTISTILTPDQDFSAVAAAQTYVVNYYTSGSEKPSVIMMCRNITTDKPASGRANIFTGEVTSVEIAE